MDPYQVLKVRSNISDEDLKKRKKELLVQFHPDKVQDQSLKKVYEERFKTVTKAYEDITILRRFRHPNISVHRSDYYDTLFAMYPRHDLYDESFLDGAEHMSMETSDIFDELEAHMRNMR